MDVINMYLWITAAGPGEGRAELPHAIHYQQEEDEETPHHFDDNSSFLGECV